MFGDTLCAYSYRTYVAVGGIRQHCYPVKNPNDTCDYYEKPANQCDHCKYAINANDHQRYCTKYALVEVYNTNTVQTSKTYASCLFMNADNNCEGYTPW